MIKRVLSLMLLAGGLLGAAPAAWADTVADKPRLAVLVDGSAAFSKQLDSKLEEMRRFDLPAPAASLKGQLAAAKITLAGEPTVEQCLKAHDRTQMDMALVGSYSKGAGGPRILARLYDLRTGEFSRELSLVGDGPDTNALANQLAIFVRQSAPLRCGIKDMQDDVVVIDLGSMDGVTQGATFKVYRYPLNLAPVEIGTVRVTDVQPFAARGEVEDTAKGMSPQAGDVLVEQTSGLLLGSQ